MRDYTYIEGYRFSIWNIYRSKRFDVDRLDINYADKDTRKGLFSTAAKFNMYSSMSETEIARHYKETIF